MSTTATAAWTPADTIDALAAAGFSPPACHDDEPEWLSGRVDAYCWIAGPTVASPYLALVSFTDDEVLLSFATSNGVGLHSEISLAASAFGLELLAKLVRS